VAGERGQWKHESQRLKRCATQNTVAPVKAPLSDMIVLGK
jgi:hypothetical protein